MHSKSIFVALFIFVFSLTAPVSLSQINHTLTLQRWASMILCRSLPAVPPRWTEIKSYRIQVSSKLLKLGTIVH